MSNLPDRYPGESTEEYHQRVQEMLHGSVAGTPVVDSGYMESDEGLKKPSRPLPTPMHVKAQRILSSALEAGEPVFVLRGRDLLSTMAIIHYQDTIDKYGAGADHQEAVSDALHQFQEWQRAHPHDVRLPD